MWPLVRRIPRVSSAQPWLYLKGVSSGDLSESLKVLLRRQAKGLSPNVLGRLKAQGTEEHERWNRRSLAKEQYV